ncbi:MAG: DUF2490 domain-containing protein [Pseudomonadota bacterium]
MTDQWRLSHRFGDARSGAVLLAVALLLSPALHADNDQTWLALAANGPVQSDSRWHFWFDGHARSRTDSDRLGLSILRPGIGYRLKSGTRLWVGYARTVNRRPGSDPEEHRYWQQATYALGTPFGGRLNGRSRLEQRTFEGTADIGHRYRQSFRFTRPLRGDRWSWFFANELFLTFNDTDFGQSSGYEQNRAYLGLAWRVAPGTRIDLSYLNNHLNPGTGGSFTNHNLSLALALSW